MNCPICETPVSDHEPGVSYVTYEGAQYHPACLYAERPDLRDDDEATQTATTAEETR